MHLGRRDAAAHPMKGTRCKSAPTYFKGHLKQGTTFHRKIIASVRDRKNGLNPVPHKPLTYAPGRHHVHKSYKEVPTDEPTSNKNLMDKKLTVLLSSAG